MEARIREWIRAHATEAADFLSCLIQMPSTQGSELEAQALMVDKFRELGMDVDVWEQGGDELTAHPHFFSPRTTFTGSPNVVGILRGAGKGRSLLINGHIDVVPPGEPEEWVYPAWSGRQDNGRIYGRGATDMKGGTVAAVLALEALRAVGARLKGDVLIESVVEEESGGSGTLSAILRGYHADAALVPEPTGMNIYAQQQGSMWLRISVRGRVAHGGTRYEGVSAIEKAVILLARIDELERHRNLRLVGDPLYAGVPIPVPINVGRISGGSWPSSVPDLVTIEGRMGVAPGEQVADARRELEEWLLATGEADPWFAEHPPEVEWFGAQWLPGGIALDHPMLRTLSTAYQKVTGSEPGIKASPWGTDGGLLTQVAGIPTVVFGPGVTGVAHAPNEYIELDAMLQVAEVMALTILQWCGRAE